jgi:hypothetical protein
MNNPSAVTGRKYGTAIWDTAGNVIELHGKVKIGDKVTWLGRKAGSGKYDSEFVVGQQYPVCYIHESNFDVELQGQAGHITTRASSTEYQC